MALAALIITYLQEAAPAELGYEGPLQNATVLLVRPESEQALLDGDRSLQAAKEGEAFEAWRSALAVSSNGDAVRLALGDGSTASLIPDREGSYERRSEGVEYAVLRRLLALNREQRAAWRSRFEPLAQSALARAGSKTREWMQVERDWPLTESAARAALALFDRELEAGRLELAQGWFERAARHAAELNVDFARALAARQRYLANCQPPAPAQEAAWQTADKLVARGSLRLVGRKPGTRSPYELPLGRLVEPGACFLADGSLVVLTPLVLVRVEPDGIVERYPTTAMLGLEQELEPYVSPIGAGWPLCIESDGTRLYWVEGRANEERDNALAALSFDALENPVVEWVLRSAGLVRTGQPAPTENALGTGRFAFQPGPVCIGERLYVQARELTSTSQGGEGTSERSWLMCFQAASGALLWQTELGRPADLGTGRGRRAASSMYTATPAQPLAQVGSRLFAGTNAGFAVLLDLVDGRVVWAFKNRRRAPEEEGWPGTRRPGVERQGDGWVVHWAPFDSDMLYSLRGGPDLGAGVYALPPRRKGEALDLFGFAGERALALGRSGARRALLEWDGTERASSLYLGREERWSGAGLASATRALVASDRALYLFDRERELYLLSAVPLENALGGRGGSVLAHGNQLWVLGLDTLWSFVTR